MKTFLDSGVLLAAWRGQERESQAALSVLDDLKRQFVTSYLVRLELLPKPRYHRQTGEARFYELHFADTVAEEPLSAELGAAALDLASEYGLAAVDALNLAAARKLGAAEFVTTEGPHKPMFRVPGLKVVSLHPAAAA